MPFDRARTVILFHVLALAPLACGGLADSGSTDSDAGSTPQNVSCLEAPVGRCDRVEGLGPSDAVTFCQGLGGVEVKSCPTEGLVGCCEVTSGPDRPQVSHLGGFCCYSTSSKCNPSILKTGCSGGGESWSSHLPPGW